MAMSSAINASDPFIVAFIDFFLDVPREVEDMASSLRDLASLPVMKKLPRSRRQVS
ncbi:MAG: hypothetical protein ACI945_001806 [Pseudohongiellaceae bacterium]|jgi:hypothetical protein